LLVDPNLYALNNRSRNRRFAFLIMLTAGSFAGAYVHRSVNSAFALLVSAILKQLVMIAFVFNKSEEVKVNPDDLGEMIMGA